MKGFLYGQTEYNILSSCNRLEEYVKYAKDNHFDYLSITDKSMYGAFKFYNLCIDNNIKPIIGIEYTYEYKTIYSGKVLLYAKDNKGYQNLVKISTLKDTKNITLLDDLNEYKNGILFIFVFNSSPIETFYLSNDESINELFDIIKSFDGYIGLSNTNYPLLKRQNEEFKRFIDGNIKWLPIHRCNYLKSDDYIIYETIRTISGNSETVGNNNYSFITEPDNNSELDNIISNINLSIYNEKPELPKFPNTKGESSHDYLFSLCDKGLRRRLKLNNVDINKYDIYFSRLKYELDVIAKMGYEDYFLIVWDFIRYSKQNDILVGPGRGSSAGSLVAYSIGITEIDPIKFNLLFERFLNIERVTMPDIDTDFPDDKRDDVIAYVKSIYGEKHICNITTFGRFKLKSSIKDLARALNMNPRRADTIVDMVEKYGFDTLISRYSDEDIELSNFLKIAKGLEDLPRNISTHPAGIILSSKELDTIVPLGEGANKIYQSQFEAPDLEKIGLLKMDFLGLRNLTMINGMIKDSGFDYNWIRNIPLNDPKVYQMLSNKDTLGIFQLGSEGIKDVLFRLKPTGFMDLVAVLALYRPGPMDNIPEFINSKHSGNIHYPHKDLEPILKETYGVIVYQEQIMQIAQVFAGFSFGEADLLRRAISKKDSSKLDSLENDFINRSVEKGYSREIAKQIYDLIYKFANYGFNKSHTVVYAYIAYQMAYFKAHYFPIFMGNMLNNVISDSKSLSEYIRYSKNHGLKIHKPNINISMNRFEITKEGLFIPFTAISSIGDLVAKKIIEERKTPFTSYLNFRERTSFLTKEQVTALIFSGALDMFGKTKKSMCENTSDEDMAMLKYINSKDQDLEYEIGYLSEMERKYLGYNIEYNVLNNYYDIIKKNRLIPLNRINSLARVNTLVHFVDIIEKKTKANEKMLVGTIEDDRESFRFVIFPDDLKKNNKMPNINELFIAVGQFRMNKNGEKDFVIYEFFKSK